MQPNTPKIIFVSFLMWSSMLYADTKSEELALYPKVHVRLPWTDAEFNWQSRDVHLVESINAKIQIVAAATISPNAKLVDCWIAYTVTKDRTIESLREFNKDKSGTNLYFNEICKAAVKSFQGSSLLDFPPGTSFDASTETNFFSYKRLKADNETAHISELPVEALTNLMKLPPNQIQQELIHLSGH